MATYLLQSFVCENCTELFEPAKEFPHCPKCNTWHILCPVCQVVHQITASEESYYLNGIESDPEFYGK